PPRSTPFPYTTLFRSGIDSIIVVKRDSREQAVPCDYDILLRLLEGGQRHAQIWIIFGSGSAHFVKRWQRRRWTDVVDDRVIFVEDRKSTRLNSSHVKI